MAIFHDMLYKEMEFYIDDLMVKSKKDLSHLLDLCKVFDRCRAYKLKMNLLKCAFGVTLGKFLGYVVHRHGIDLDPDKVKAIQEIPQPLSMKQLKSFLGKFSYLRRFIPMLAEIT